MSSSENRPRSAGEAIAMLRLHDVWFPNSVVLNAIIEWMNEAMLGEASRNKAQLALRWCKWQRLMTKNDGTEASQYSELFSQFSRFFANEEAAALTELPFISSISSSELAKLSSDLEDMKSYRSQFVSRLRHSPDYAPSCERHLWGSISDGIGGAQSHFWRLLDVLP